MSEDATRTDPARILLIAGAAIALSHLANEWVAAAALWGLIWKAAGIVVLGLYALSRRAFVAGLGLLLSSAGDVLLEIDGLFVGGMAAFGLAHVCYTIAFANIIRRNGLNRSAWPIAAGVLVVSAVLGYWLAPGMGEKGLLVPALAYQLLISAMVVTAAMSRAPLLARLGAAIFMLSDTLIAVGLFAKIDVATGSVWITYAAAQIMLAWGLSRPHSLALAEQG
jgi:uncharacterized membrane protein YhhN